MKDYIEKCLRRPIIIEKNVKILKLLPLKFKGMYDLFTVQQDGVEWMIVRPKDEVRLNTLRYDRNQIEKVSGLNCALYFTKLNQYTKDTMQNEGIPFIIEQKQMFLPFLGMLLSEKNDRRLAPIHTISFLTQKLLLCALYEKWNGMNVTKIADRLGVSKMSVSRCLDEMEYLDVDILDISGKTRKVSVGNETRRVWEIINPIMRNPVITRFQLAEDICLKKKAGISALCEYSLLSDNPYPTYAITKKELNDVQIKSFRQVFGVEEIGCEVLELGYFLDLHGKEIQDPLSVLLSLSEEDMEDERVQICIDEMLEDYVW
ncbi:MAG: MarR family transcriptional regulator [Tyzzerella sp.]|nr:MarR family transcriptional regulator [Tyzzerella sp.]